MANSIQHLSANQIKCFKKSMQKLITLMIEDILNNDISDIEWWMYIEETYGSEKSPRFNLRHHLTVRQMFEIAKEAVAGIVDFEMIQDKQQKRKALNEKIIELGSIKGITKEMMQLETDCYCKAS